MRTLGIDLGKQTGWGALGSGHPPRFGSMKIVAQWQPLGDSLLILEDHLHKLILRHRPDQLAVARPFVRTRFDTPQNLLPMYGCFTVLCMMASSMKLPLIVVNESAARTRLVGKNMLRRKSAQAKQDVIQAWRSRGVEVTDDHEADALCVALEAIAQADPTRDYATTPLFDAAATVRARRSAA